MLEVAATTTPNYLPAIATILAAIIGALIIYSTARHNAQHAAKLELAKFRLEWIQRLRDALSEFQSYAVLPNFEPHKERKFYELGTQIELLLNPDEEPNKDLLKQMYSMLDVSSGTITDKYQKNPEFILSAQKILKSEWDRARNDLLKKKKKNNAKNQ